MIYEAKKSTDTWFPVILLDDTDGKTPETGKIATEVNCKWFKCDGSYTLTAYSTWDVNWDEKGEGMYTIQLGASEFVEEAKYEAAIAVPGCRTHRFAIECRDRLISEIDNDIVSIKADADTITGADGVTLATAQALYAPAKAGDAMTLAADSIKKVTFDETTAWPLLAADTGATAIARTGADGDTLETLSDEIATAQSDLNTITGTDGVTLATAQSLYAPSKAGDLMGLSNDAITSEKFDESTAFPLKSADAGATQVARVGADSDTLETLSDQIDTVSESVSKIGTAGGAAVTTPVATDNSAGGISGVTVGTTKVGTETNTYTSTYNENGVYHIITHAGNAIDWVYQLLIGGGAQPISVVWKGYLVGSNDTITVDVWDHVGNAWDSAVTSFAGTALTVNVTKIIPLYAKHAGTSVAELGKVYVRFRCTAQSTPVLNTDQLFVQYAITSRTVGYANGEVWLDTVNGFDGAVSYVNGTADHPCNTWANALTIAVAVGLKRIHIHNGSSIQLTATLSNYLIEGHNYAVDLNGQDVSNTVFHGANISGIATGTNPQFVGGEVGTCTLPGCELIDCHFSDTVTFVASGEYHIIGGNDGLPSTLNPTFVFAASVQAAIRNWRGGINISTLASTNYLAIDGDVRIVLQSSCNGGAVITRGSVDILDQVAGGFVGGGGTLTQTAAYNQQNVADALKLAPTTGSPATGSVNADLDTIKTTQTTAQNDLDTITGTDGATLATAQGLYAPSKAGDAMTLAADAIKAVSFDETTAWPLAAADSGATAVARTGADSDTLETLSDQIDGVTALTAQEVRDAMKLAPTAGAPAAGSVDAQLDTIETDTTTDIPTTIAALPTAADNATAVMGKTVDTGMDVTATLKRVLAVQDGDTTVVGSGPFVHTIKDKSGNENTTHSISTTGNRTVT